MLKGQHRNHKHKKNKKRAKGKGKVQENPSLGNNISDSDSEVDRNFGIALDKLHSFLVGENGGANVGSQFGPSEVTSTALLSPNDQLKQCQNKPINKGGKRYIRVSELSRTLSKKSAKGKGKMS